MATPSYEEFYKLARAMPENRMVRSGEIRQLYDNNYKDQYEREQTGDFVAGVKGGVASLGAIVDSGQAFLGDVVGADDFRDRNIEEARLGFEEASKWGIGRSTQLEDIDGIGDAIDYLQYTLGSLAPSAAESMLAGAAGAIAGGATGGAPGAAGGLITGLASRTAIKTLAKRFVENGVEKKVADETAEQAVRGYLRGEVQDDIVAQAVKQGRKTAGATIALVANEYGMGVGESYNTTVEAGEASPGKAALTAIPFAAAGVVPEALLAGRILNRAPGTESIIGATGRGAVRQAPLEGTAEFLQEGTQIALEQNVSGESVDNKGSTLLNAFAAGAVGGGTIGGGMAGVQAAVGAQVDPIAELARTTKEQMKNKAMAEVKDADLTIPEASLEAEALNLDQLADANRYLNMVDEQTKLDEMELAEAQRDQQERERIKADLRKRDEQLDDQFAVNSERQDVLGDIRDTQGDRRARAKPAIDKMVNANNERQTFNREFTDTDTLANPRTPEADTQTTTGAVGDALTQALTKTGKTNADLISRYESDVTKKNGQPFKTQSEAMVASRSKANASKNLTPTEVTGGWVLRNPENVGREAVVQTTVDAEPEAVTQPENVVDAEPKMATQPETLVDAEPEMAVDPVTLPTSEKVTKAYYTDNLKSMGDSLVRGGNMGYLRDENDKIIGRTGSENPLWFQQIGESVPNVSTVYVKSTLKKLEDKGYDSLTPKQQNVVDYLIDVVDGEMEANASLEERQRLVNDYDNLGNEFEQGIQDTDNTADREAVPEARSDTDTTAEEAGGGSARNVQAPTERPANPESNRVQDQEDSGFDEGQRLTEQEADDFFGIEKNDSTESPVNDDLTAGQADLPATPTNVEPARNEESADSEPVNNQRVKEVESVTLESMDDFDNFVATADPDLSYEISWPNGNVTKIRNVENSIPRLEKIAQKLFPENPVATNPEPEAAATETPATENQFVKDEPEGFYSTERKGNGDPTDAEATMVADGVRGKSMLEATQWLIDNAPTKSYRAIASRVLERLNNLQSEGITLNPIQLLEGNQRLNALGTTRTDYPNKRGTTQMDVEQSSVTVTLNGPDMTGYVGTTFETLLHELLHAALDSTVRYGNMRDRATTDLGKNIGELYKLFNDTVAEFNKRLADGTLDSGFKKLAEQSNALLNPNELITWGLTNGKFQQFLMTVKTENNQSVWSKLVETIRDFLGMDSNMDNALGQLLRITDGLLDSDVSDVIGGNSQRQISNMLSRNAFFGTDSLPADSNQTTTTAFKRWFGNSKVVDDSGEPMVVYHGTNAEIKSFIENSDEMKKGFYFTPDKDGASTWASLRQEKNGGEAKTYSVYLSLKKPKYVDRSVMDKIKRFLSDRRSSFNMDLDASKKTWSFTNADIEAMKADGYDGVINKVSGDIVVFDANQIKSATSNNGNFDSLSTNISEMRSFAVTPETRQLIEKRGVKARSKMKSWFNRYFTYAGNADRETANLKIMTDAEKNGGQKELHGMIADFKRSAIKAFGVKGFYDIPEARRNAMNEYLAGEPAALPQSVKDGLDVMRSYTDMWSDNMVTALGEQFTAKIDKMDERTQRKFYEEGIVPENMMGLLELRELIESNKGTYLNRSFRIFQEGTKYAEEVVENADLMQRAMAEIKENQLYRTAGKAIGTRAKDRDAKVDAAAEYLRTELASDLLTDQQIGRLDVLRDQLLTESQVEGEVKRILTEAAGAGDMSSLIASGRMYGSKDVSILKKKNKGISETMLELLGEFKDPGVNFVNSNTKMQAYVANHNFLHSLHINGQGKFILNKPDVINGIEYTTEIKGENTMNPLVGMFVTADFAQAMEDMQGGFDSSNLMNQIIKYNSLVKYGKTVLSPTTQFRNFLAGPMFIFNMGHNPFSKGFVDTAKIAYNDLFKNDTKFNDYITKLIKLGVMHDNANSTEMRKTLEDFTETMGSMTVDTRGFMGKLKMVNEKFQRAYQWGDDFWKLMAFEQEKADWLAEGLNEADAEARAAYRVRNGVPTYSMVPRAFQLLRRTPLVGSFVAFPYEAIRTSYRNIMFLQEDIQAGRNKMAAKRFAGMTVTTSAAYALSKLTMQLFGLTDEDDEAIKLLGPDWSKNALFLYTGFDEKTGAPTFIDTSYTDPYAMFKKIINGLVSGNNMGAKEKIQSALFELTDPFIGTDIVAGALGEIIFNQKESGGIVYNEQDTATNQLRSVTDHMRKALQPGVAANAERITRAVFDIKTPTGREFDFTNEMIALFGVRSITLDSGQAMTYKGYALNDELRDAQSLLSRVAADRNNVSPRKMEAVFRNSMSARENTYRRAIKIIDGMRTIGVSDQEIRSSLRAANFSVKNMNTLMQGNIPKWEMSGQFIDTAAKRVRASSVPDAEKIEVLREFNERKRQIRQLAREY